MSDKIREQAYDQVEKKCPVCGGKNNITFLRINNVPVHCCLILSEREEAIQTKKGDIRLSYCVNCGHIFNKAFNSSMMSYSERYENALYFSTTFQKYAEKLASYLVKQYQLIDKIVIDIGCGQGYFLSKLCNLGNNRGIGFDPSYRFYDQDLEYSSNVKFVQDYYSRQTGSYRADMIVCRQVLEHVYDPDNFLNVIKETVGQNAPGIFFEVPNAEFMLKRFSIWDVIYEHYSYFSKQSIATLFQSHGFQVEKVYELFNDQYLAIEAKLMKGNTLQSTVAVNEDLRKYALQFERFLKNKIRRWKKRIQEWSNNNIRFSLWGAGAKGITFLNFLDIQYHQMPYVIDVNPRKQGKFVNGTGQKIMSPEFLMEYQPNFVIIMNPAYEEEIKQELMQLGVNAELIIV